MKPAYEALVVLATALYHAGERVGKPLLEVAVRLEHVRHEEVHQRPQLHQAVLQRCAGQQQSALAVEVQQRLPALRLEVLYVLRLFSEQSNNSCGADIKKAIDTYIYIPIYIVTKIVRTNPRQ